MIHIQFIINNYYSIFLCTIVKLRFPLTYTCTSSFYCYAKNLPVSSLKFHCYFQPFPLSQVGCFYFYFYLLEYSLSTDLVIIWSIFAVDQPFLGNLGTTFFYFQHLQFYQGALTLEALPFDNPNSNLHRFYSWRFISHGRILIQIPGLKLYKLPVPSYTNMLLFYKSIEVGV